MSIHLTIGNPWSREVIMDAMREAAEVSGCTVDDIMSRKQDTITSQARQAVMWQAHNCGVSDTFIGRFLRRDHTTVIHGRRAAQSRFEENSKFQSVPFFKSSRT